MAAATENALPVTLSYIGCWYKNDMYSHNCSKMVDSLRQCGMQVDVVTSNCRCFSSAQKFAITEDELINTNCTAIAIPHAPRSPGKGQGTLKYLAVKWLRLDLPLATLRGFLYYNRARRMNSIQFDQVLEALRCFLVPLWSCWPTCLTRKWSSRFMRLTPSSENINGRIACITGARQFFSIAKT